MFKQQLWLSIKSLFEYTKKLTQGLKSKIKSRNNVWNKASEGIYCDLIGPKMLSKSSICLLIDLDEYIWNQLILVRWRYFLFNQFDHQEFHLLLQLNELLIEKGPHVIRVNLCFLLKFLLLHLFLQFSFLQFDYLLVAHLILIPVSFLMTIPFYYFSFLFYSFFFKCSEVLTFTYFLFMELVISSLSSHLSVFLTQFTSQFCQLQLLQF